MGLHRNCNENGHRERVLSLFPGRSAGRGESSAGDLAVNDATLTILFFSTLYQIQNIPLTYLHIVLVLSFFGNLLRQTWKGRVYQALPFYDL